MNLPQLSVKRPVTVIMVTLIFVILGLVSLLKLPVELNPNTSLGEISIVIYVRGQIPPSEVEAQVTRLVEDAVSTVANLKNLLSISKEGESTVVLSFEPGTDMEFAALEVREKFSRIKHKLPKEIEKPIIAQYKQNDLPVLVFAITSPLRKPEEIRSLVDEKLKERFKRINGVANVEVAGGRERKILVEIDQQKTVAYGVSSDEITGGLSANNLNLLSGDVDRKEDTLLVRMIGEFTDMNQIKNLGLKKTEYGSMLRIADVATVKDDYLDPTGYARYNERDIVSIYVQKETTKNTISVVDEVLKEVDAIKKEIPKDIQIVSTSNQAILIRKAIDSLQESLVKGSVLIVLVFFLFLFHLKPWQYGLVLAGLLVTLAVPAVVLVPVLGVLIGFLIAKPRFRLIIVVTLPIPVSVISTFLFMKFNGLTLNVMTLFGLALGVGMLVDNSVVVFDSILKKREAGHGLAESAEYGSNEVLLAIIAGVLTHIIVFLPLIFMSKEIQLLYSNMAITVIVSLLISLITALTIVPLAAAKPALARHMVDQRPPWLHRVYLVEKRFMKLALRHAKMVLAASTLVVLVAGYFISKFPLEYMGSTQDNRFTTFVEMPTGTKLEVTNETVKRVEKLLKTAPEVKNVTSRVEPWSAKVYTEVVSATERKRSINQIIEAVRPQTKRLAPAFIYFEEEQQVGTKELTVEVFGYDYKILRQLAIGMANRLQNIPGLTDLKIRMREGRPEMAIQVDKQRAANFNLTTEAVADQVHAKMRGLRATLFREKGLEVETITRLEEKYRKTFRDLYKMVLTNDRGEPVLLEQVAAFKFDLGPSEIWRKNKDRMIQVSANLNDVPLSIAVQKVHASLADLEFPENYYYRIGGDYSNLVKMGKEMKVVVVMVLVLIYLILAALFESYSQPVLIMIAIPLALVGTVAGLLAGPKTIGVGAMLGMMMLAGIVVNNSIILIDRANFYHFEKRYRPLRAIILANKDRFRPILLTSTTTLLGLIPMAFDRSESSNLWSPLAYTVIGGLFSSLVLTLLLMPTFYMTFIKAGPAFRSFFPDLKQAISARLRALQTPASSLKE